MIVDIMKSKRKDFKLSITRKIYCKFIVQPNTGIVVSSMGIQVLNSTDHILLFTAKILKQKKIKP